MIYNTRNQRNDTSESLEETKGPVLMLIFSTVSQNHGTE